MPDDTLSLYTLYDRPRDYPRAWVIRRWEVQRGNPEPKPADSVFVFETREAAFEWAKTRGLATIMRSPGDDPAIVATFL